VKKGEKGKKKEEERNGRKIRGEKKKRRDFRGSSWRK
jgi:hypothetical protein